MIWRMGAIISLVSSSKVALDSIRISCLVGLKTVKQVYNSLEGSIDIWHGGMRASALI